MYHCTLYLKNKSDWLIYAKNIIGQSNDITDEVIEKILSFPFQFESFDSDS